MGINIYDLYISFNKNDMKIFNMIMNKILKYQKGNNIMIIHIMFNKSDRIYNIKNYKKKLNCEIHHLYDNNYFTNNIEIDSIEDIIRIFKKNNKPGKNVFMYSGHSDGLLFVNKHIYFISLKEFGYIIKKVLGKKCDLIIGDACLMGNISALNIFKDYTKYMLASPTYYNYESMLEMKKLYKLPNKKDEEKLIITYIKKLMNEYITVEKNKFKAKNFMAHVVLYEMNDNIDKLTNLLLKYKNKFKYHNCAIYKKDFYYLDIICELKDKVPEKVEEAEKYINNIVKYNKYYDIGNNIYGKLIMILRKPYIKFDYDSDIFF
jgi:hypothetical protein